MPFTRHEDDEPLPIIMANFDPLSVPNYENPPHFILMFFRPGAVVMDGKMYVAGGRDPDISHSDLDTMEVFDDVTQVCSLTAQFVMIFSIYLASQLYEMSKTELG